MTNAYFVRITHAYAVARVVVETWAPHCEKVLVYEHIGSKTEKVHIHLVLFGCKYDKKWMRQLGARTGVDLKGNERCSFKEYDGDATAMVYMTKGTLEPVFNKGYSTGEISLWKSQYKRVDQTKAERMYDELFADEEYSKQHWEDFYASYKNDPLKPLCVFEIQFIWLRSVAYNHALLKNRYMVTPKMINDYKMLVLTYCARNGLPIPPGYPGFRKYELPM